MQRTYERPTGRRKELYILSLDSGRLFWVVVISLLVLAFLFLLGYWIGHDTVTAGMSVFGDARGNTGANALQSELERIGQQNTGDGAQDARRSDNALLAQPGEDEKPLVSNESFVTKTEKNEFEALKQPKPIAPAVPKQTAAASPKPSAPKPAAKKEASGAGTAAKTQTAKTDGKYLVQVASLSSRTSAENLSKTLEKKQYTTTIMETVVNGKDYYRVRVGGFASYDAAANAMRAIQDSGDGKGCYIVQM